VTVDLAPDRSHITELLPRYDAVERHEIRVDAPPDVAYAAVRGLDLARSPVIAALLAVRGVPHLLSGRAHLSRRIGIDAVLDTGFVLLAEEPPRVLVLGIVGRFWRLTSGIHRITSDEFAGFDEPGFAKGVWSFTVDDDGHDGSVVRTETRVACTDAVARRRFLRYWRVVGPFSGLIRVLLLRSIKRAAESTTSD
jgi:hypothetical protein